MSSIAQKKGERIKGWLHKRGGRIHTWHKRWFVLTGDLLFYYKSPHDSRPTGTIPLAGNGIIRHPDDSKQPSYKFEIVGGSAGQVITGNHESYLISAESAEVADNWVTAIRRVMHEPYGGGMFGRSLEETMQVEARLGGTYVPILLHRCVQFILEQGLHEVGIFRLPGQASQIQGLRNLYDAGSQEDFSDTEDVHTVASLLKLYLRELPEPVIPYVYYESYKQALEAHFKKREDASCSEAEGIDKLKRLFIQLPKPNFNVLKYLSRFLSEVEECSDDNKMNVVNLGTIFGPHLLSPQTDDPQVLMECNSISTDFVTAVVTNQSDFFPSTNDEITPKRLSIVFKRENVPALLQTEQQAEQLLKIGQRSFYQQKSPLLLFRQRQNSAPTVHKERSGKRSKHATPSFGQAGGSRKVEITGPILQQPDLTTSTPVQDTHAKIDEEKESDQEVWKSSPLFTSNDSSDDEDIPEMIKRLSQNGLSSESRMSDTLSSDMIVNSISSELEALEWQLSDSRQDLLQYKKSAQLWKTRYEMEARARIAAEERVRDLQHLIDETFQQLALEDSEDDLGTSTTLLDMQESSGSTYPSSSISLSSLKTFSSTPALNKYPRKASD